VVFVSSLHDTFLALRPGYSTTKAAVAMLVRELAYELGRHRIRVNAVSPGSIRTKSNPIPVDEDPSIARIIPVGRSGDPDDVAKLVVVLLSDAWAGYVTGVNLPVDGGLGLHSWLMDE
jgi:3-oxoacyl-[acyl-carrier protein] reductase